MNGLAGGLHESSVPALTRIRHGFFTVAPEPSALTALPDPQAGTPRAPRRAVQYACGALGRAWRNALRTAFSTPRYKNLCIIRAKNCPMIPGLSPRILCLSLLSLQYPFQPCHCSNRFLTGIVPAHIDRGSIIDGGLPFQQRDLLDQL